MGSQRPQNSFAGVENSGSDKFSSKINFIFTRSFLTGARCPAPAFWR